MSEVTRILSAIEQGDERVADQLLPLVYDELRRLAERHAVQVRDLQGDLALEGAVGAARQPHFAHAARAQRPQQLVGAEPFARLSLDPPLVPSSATPEPDGLSISLLTRLVSEVLAMGKVRVVSVAGLNPGGGKRGETSVESAMQVIVNILGAFGADGNANA